MKVSVFSGPGSAFTENDDPGVTVDAFAVARLYQDALNCFAIMENTDVAAPLQWQMIGRAVSGGNEEVLYGPTKIDAGFKDSAVLQGGVYGEIRIEVKSDGIGNPATYKLQSSALVKI